jgi:sugar phosphate isomerase/epimerase
MKVGIQLFSVRNLMARDPIAAIKAVTKMGYRALEVANHSADTDIGVGFGVGAKELLRVLDGEGASVVSAHIFPMVSSVMDAILEYFTELGTKYIVMPMDFFKSREDTLKKAEILNAIGRHCAKMGMVLLYHNHFHEFQRFGETTAYELLMEHTDPVLVKIELDTYWAARGGHDVVALLKKYKERVRLLHQKDFPTACATELDLIDAVNRNAAVVDLAYFQNVVTPESFTEIGTGMLPIQDFITVGNDVCKVDYLILEQDFSAHDELESLRISMDSLKRYSGITW